MEKSTWIAVIATAIIVAILSSVITANITGNTIRVSPAFNGTEIYTKAEIDSMIGGINSQISSLSAQVANLAAQITGSLIVASYPSSASLYVDGAYKGLTPMTVSGLSVGNHAVSVTKSGYNTYSTSKYVYVGSNSLNVTLNPVANVTNVTYAAS